MCCEGGYYQRTKQVLHTALPADDLVGRSTESKVISDFLHEHLSHETAGSMYVSGAPGTGKTAVLLKAVERLKV
jgi:cell division control protein 6